MPKSYVANPAQSILDALRTTVDHDLPNLFVAFHGLLRLLEEGRDDWTASEKESLGDLVELIVRLQTTATALRSLYKAGYGFEPPERIRLSDLLREAAAGVKTALPRRVLHFHTVLKKTEVDCPRRLLLQAMIESFAVLGDTLRSREVHYSITSRRTDKTVELTLLACSSKPQQDISEEKEQSDSPANDLKKMELSELINDRPERRLRLLLLREWSAIWGGRAFAAKDKDGNPALILTIPNAPQS